MNKFIKTFMIAVTLVFLLVACSSKSSNSSKGIKPLEIDLAAVYNDDSPDVEGAKKFAEIVEEKTNGEIKVNIFSNGTLGSEKDNFTELSSGDLDMALGGSAGIEMFAEEYMFFLAPFLIEDLDHLEEWFESDLHEDMTERMKENNVRHLGDIVRGARNTTANKPVETPEDLEELKFRLPETDTLVEVFSALGAKPTSVSLDELYSSLQTGVVDASEGPYEQIASNQLDEVQDYLIKTEHIFDVSAIWINEDFFESLTEEQQKIITSAGEEAAQYASDTALNKQDEYLEQLEKSDMKIMDLTDEQLDVFKEKAKPTLEKMFKEKFTVTTYEDFLSDL